jgi:hypothetical protein
MTVLVLTRQLDPVADLVVAELNTRGAPVVRLDPGHLPERGRFTARLGDRTGWAGMARSAPGPRPGRRHRRLLAAPRPAPHHYYKHPTCSAGHRPRPVQGSAVSWTRSTASGSTTPTATRQRPPPPGHSPKPHGADCAFPALWSPTIRRQRASSSPHSPAPPQRTRAWEPAAPPPEVAPPMHPGPRKWWPMRSATRLP